MHAPVFLSQAAEAESFRSQPHKLLHSLPYKPTGQTSQKKESSTTQTHGQNVTFDLDHRKKISQKQCASPLT